MSERRDDPEFAAKPGAASRAMLASITVPGDANAFGAVHGGVILRLADECGAIAALRHAGSPRITTAAIDSFVFLAPIAIGERVEAIAEVSYAGRSSIESRIEVFAEPLNSVEGRRKVAEGFGLYVALDLAERPQVVPALLIETDDDRHRQAAARARQAVRVARREEARAEPKS